MPRVSVIIPTYNRKEYVQEAIDSVLAQTYTDYEIIVIDDGSSDVTGEALRARYGDRIRYIWQENQGESAARNYGIGISQGEFVALLDSDDLWLPDKLAKQIDVLDRNPDKVLVFTASWKIDATGRRLESLPVCSNVDESQLTLESLCLKNAMGYAVSTVLIRRHTLELVGRFDPTIRYGEDWDLWLKLRRQGEFISLNEPLACYRQHGGSQWHNPSPETIDQRLVDHQRMLEKVFKNWPDDVPAGLPEHAAARAYGIAGYLDYVIGRVSSGKQRLKLAIQLDPVYRSDLQELPAQLKYHFQFVNSDPLTNMALKKRLNLAVGAFENLPEELGLPGKFMSQTLRDLFVHFLFTSYKAHDFSTTRYCLVKAVSCDLSLLRNRGVWSISLEVFLGTRTANLMRRLVRYNRTVL